MVRGEIAIAVDHLGILQAFEVLNDSEASTGPWRTRLAPLGSSGAPLPGGLPEAKELAGGRLVAGLLVDWVLPADWLAGQMLLGHWWPFGVQRTVMLMSSSGCPVFCASSVEYPVERNATQPRHLPASWRQLVASEARWA